LIAVWLANWWKRVRSAFANKQSGKSFSRFAASHPAGLPPDFSCDVTIAVK